MIILVMVDDSPLWYRASRSREHSGVAEATDLGLSASLRHDLQAWNDIFEQVRQEVFENLATVGQLLRKWQPDFDSRNWGYPKLSGLVRATGQFTIAGQRVRVEAHSR